VPKSCHLRVKLGTGVLGSASLSDPSRSAAWVTVDNRRLARSAGVIFKRAFEIPPRSWARNGHEMGTEPTFSVG
jgi:hypothetical protein